MLDAVTASVDDAPVADIPIAATPEPPETVVAVIVAEVVAPVITTAGAKSPALTVVAVIERVDIAAIWIAFPVVSPNTKPPATSAAVIDTDPPAPECCTANPVFAPPVTLPDANTDIEQVVEEESAITPFLDRPPPERLEQFTSIWQATFV